MSADNVHAILESLAQVTPDDDVANPLTDRIRAGVLDSAGVKALPAPEPLIGGYLVRNSLALLYGASGLAKTFTAIDMALHVAYGAWWHGQPVSGGSVLYVVGEGVSGIGQRIDAWEKHNRMHQEVHPVRWLPWAVNIFDPAWAGALAEVVDEWEPALIVLDTFARCAVGAEENSAKDVGQVVANLDTIRRVAGSCVATVHHAGKDNGAGARGSSALRAAMDTELELTGEPQRLALKVTKQKDGPEAPPMRLGLVVVEGTGSCAIDVAGDIDPDDLPSSVASTLLALEAIDLDGGMSPTAWHKSADVPERTFYRHRKNLVDAGLVVNVGTDKTPKYRPASGLLEGSNHVP